MEIEKMEDNSNWFLGMVTFILGLPSTITAWLTLKNHKISKNIQAQVTTINRETIVESIDRNEEGNVN